MYNMEKPKWTWQNWFILATVVLLVLFLQQCHTNSVKNQELAIYERNMQVARDSINLWQLKSGAWVAERDAFILSTEAASVELGLSKDRIKELERKLGSAWETITQLRSEVRVDTMKIPVWVDRFGDSLLIGFDYQDIWMALEGTVQCFQDTNCEMVVDRMAMDIPVTVGLTESKTFFVTSENPYVRFTDITSAVNIKSIPKKKRWTFGLNLGPGVYYDALHNNVALGVGVQVGLNFNF